MPINFPKGLFQSEGDKCCGIWKLINPCLRRFGKYFRRVKSTKYCTKCTCQPVTENSKLQYGHRTHAIIHPTIQAFKTLFVIINVIVDKKIKVKFLISDFTGQKICIHRLHSIAKNLVDFDALQNQISFFYTAKLQFLCFLSRQI
jgi:hypothetical protein